MKHAGKARCAALKLILLALIAACVIGAAGWLLKAGVAAAIVAGALWLVFSLFTFYFFRDPTAMTPQGPGLVVAPGHGKVDVIEQLTQSSATAAPCHRLSIFLSVIDIHVQNAPVSGKITGSRAPMANSSARCGRTARSLMRMFWWNSIPRKRRVKKSACG